MFQFPGLALNPYVFRVQYLLMISVSPKTNPSTDSKPVLGITEIEGGFPHSEIRGSKLIRSSPRLIAAYHVLHRLSAPRHPPNALKTLDRSHDRCPPVPHVSRTKDRRDQKRPLQALARRFACKTQPVLSQRANAPKLVSESSARSLQPAMFPLDDVKHPQTPDGTREFHELSGSEDRRRRTDDRYSIVLCRPSSVIRRLVEPDGIEPTTSSLQS